ncbi:hypothetical protein [Chryseobacterium sp. CT-SW4]
MKSRIFKTILTILAPLVLEYLLKKFTEKKDDNKQIASNKP